MDLECNTNNSLYGDEMSDLEEMKEFIKDNLLIEVELDDKSGAGNSVTLSLRFINDEPFCKESIYIPEEQ